MEIKIIGKNSSNRMKLLKNVEKVLETKENVCNLQILEDDKYKQIYHVVNTPALLIDGKVMSQGKILTEREIKRFLLANN